MKTLRMFWRAIGTFVVVSLLLAGCGGTSAPAAPAASGGGDTAASSGGAATAAPAQAAPASGGESAAAPSELEILFNAGGAQIGKPDPIGATLDKALGTHVNLTLFSSPDDYINQLNVRMAAGNSPDMFAVDRTQMEQFAKQGQLLDLTPYMDKLKPTADFVGEDSIKKGTYDGKVYAIAKTPQVPYNTIWIRKDWLDKLGLQPPTNLDELMKVAVAFTENDPDGNGKKDTYGLTGVGFDTFSTIFGAYGVGQPGSFYMKDGKLVNAYYDPAMKDALAYIQKLVASGAVDPEFAANTGLKHQEKAFQGQAGMIYIDWPNMTKAEYVKQYKTVNPNAEWEQVGAISGPGGNYVGTWDIGRAPAMFAISRAVEKDPAKLEKLIDLLNYVSTKDGSLLVQYGVKGEHFNLDGDKVVPTDLLAKQGGYFWVYQFTGRPELTYLKTKFANQNKEIDFAAGLPRIQGLNGFLTVPEGYNPADADRFTQEQLLNFVNGTRPLSEYDAFLQELEGSFNYKTYLDSATQQLAALGYK